MRSKCLSSASRWRTARILARVVASTRAQAAGFKFARLPRFLACFRIHDAQKTASTYAIGVREMGILRRRVLGFDPTQMQIRRAIAPYLARQVVFHYAHKLSLLRC